MIRFEHVFKRYPGSHEALSDLSLHVRAGEMSFLTGHSGAGKSTLLKLIGLLERASRGQVWVNGRNLNKLKRRDVPYHRREVGMIFQDNRLLHDRTVFDNIAFGPRRHGLRNKGQISEIVERSLVQAALWDEVKDKLHQSAMALSGGQQQRLCIARAVATEPDVLLMDEHRLYDASDPQDRVVLGIAGAFSEFEISLIIDRMQVSQQEKAARGELYEGRFAPGYVCSVAPLCEKHPDERVQRAVMRVFDHFDRYVSVLQLHRELLTDNFELPVVPAGRDWRDVEWVTPSYDQLLDMGRVGAAP